MTSAYALHMLLFLWGSQEGRKSCGARQCVRDEVDAELYPNIFALQWLSVNYVPYK